MHCAIRILLAVGMFLLPLRVFAEDGMLLSLFTQLRYYGQEDRIFLVVTVENQTGANLNAVEIKTAILNPSGTIVRQLPKLSADKLDSGFERSFVLLVDTTGLTPGIYMFRSLVLNKEGKELVCREKEVIIQKYKVPEWVKRARLFWQYSWSSNYPYWVSVPVMEKQLNVFADSGATVVDNQCCQDYFNATSPSYPLVRDFSPLVDSCHELGMKYIWYQSSCTASEYFIHQHRDWLTTPAFYTCGWLSFPPGCPKWSECLAGDLGDLIARAGIDGIMLDNADAFPPGSGKEYYTRQAVLTSEHFATLWEGIKKQKPLGALIPNYGTFQVAGLKLCSAGWDAHIKEGAYACAFKNVASQGYSIKDFVHRFSRVREISGKPVLPLSYAPDRKTGNLSIGATIAAGCTPGNNCAEKSYYQFIDNYQEYFYAPGLVPVAGKKVVVNPDDDDIALASYRKIYPSGMRDYVIHLLNAQSGEREVTVNFPYPLDKVCLISPERPLPVPIAVTKEEGGRSSFSVKIETWAVILGTDEILPMTKLNPKVIRVTKGEDVSFQVELTNFNLTSQKVTVSFRLPKGFSVHPAVDECLLSPMEKKRIIFMLSADKKKEKGIEEVYLQARSGERAMEIPCEVEVKDPIEILAKPDCFPANVRRPNITFILTNNSKEKKTGLFSVDVPKGWLVVPSNFEYDLSVGEKKTVSSVVTMPRIDLNGFFDIRDYPFRLRLAGTGEIMLKEIPVRRHSPIVWLVTCNLHSPPKDIINSGAGVAPISQFLFPVRGYECNSLEDALKKVNKYLDDGENVTLWLRVHDKSTDLSDIDNQKALEKFVVRGGGLLLQENLFRNSPENLGFLDSIVSPIGKPYEVTSKKEGWVISNSSHPAISFFATDTLEGKKDIKVKQEVVNFQVKDWAEVVARTESGTPAIVLSKVPERKVGYIGGVLEGKYLYGRQGYRAPEDQITHIICLYIDLIRWLGRPNDGK